MQRQVLRFVLFHYLIVFLCLEFESLELTSEYKPCTYLYSENKILKVSSLFESLSLTLGTLHNSNFLEEIARRKALGPTGSLLQPVPPCTECRTV